VLLWVSVEVVVAVGVGQDDGADLRGRHAGLGEAGDELTAGRAEGGAAAGVDQHQLAGDAHEQNVEGDVDAGRGQQGRREAARDRSGRLADGERGGVGRGVEAAVGERDGLEFADFQAVVAGLRAR
jgi:hypothetical protein